ncbi:hypothetical protein DFH27DRAFT_245464 [Peziza echinospora]|nr:hypothetical protein DFH27DRAFT_245464 [Peziza echinospora]
MVSLISHSQLSNGNTRQYKAATLIQSFTLITLFQTFPLSLKSIKMQFKLAIFTTLSIIFSVALAAPQWGSDGPINEDDNQNENINVNENNNQQDEFIQHDFNHASEILSGFCNRDAMGNLQLLGKRSEFAKRDGGLQGFPGFENFDFNNNQNANVNQNALLNEDISQQFDRFDTASGHGGDFINGLAGAGIGGLVDCFLGESGELIEGRLVVKV